MKIIREIPKVKGTPVLWLARCPKCLRVFQRGETSLNVECDCGTKFEIMKGE
jgi:hypothetical protein